MYKKKNRAKQHQMQFIGYMYTLAAGSIINLSSPHNLPFD